MFNNQVSGVVLNMNILTFDIEDWFHVLDNAPTRGVDDWARYPSRFEPVVDRLLTILDERNLKATFFCLGWMAEHHPHVIRRIHSQGHEIGTHSYAHQLAYEQTPEQFTHDFKCSLAVLEDATGEKVRAYRAPGFSLTSENRWVFDILVEHGIEVDCSVFPAGRAHGGFAEFGTCGPAIVETRSGQLKEFPINVWETFGLKLVFSGGGYFRLLPYSMIRALARRSPYLMTYFHPRDFDPDQPLIPGLNAIRRFKSYYGLRSAENKLERFLDEFEFIDLRTAVSRVDWSEARRFVIS
jgi:polysaccharide deacetylase family protein (PEP-CTERM system associated)